MHKIIKLFSVLLTVTVFLFGGFAIYLANITPSTYLVSTGENLEFVNMPYLEVTPVGSDGRVSAQNNINSYNVQLSLLGIIPIKPVRVEMVDNKVIDVLGVPFGIKMFSDGIMVVSFTDIYTLSGYKNPAKSAGILAGDIIKEIEGKIVKTNEDVSKFVSECKDGDLDFLVERKGEEMHFTLYPEKENSTGNYKTGMWVRDSSAGLGTLTFIDRDINVFAGLGHGINDNDTGTQIPLLTGEIVPVEINGVVKGTSGIPGELKGNFPTTDACGKIAINSDVGVYGTVEKFSPGVPMEIEQSQNIHVGDVQILTTIDSGVPKYYNAEIEKIVLANKDTNKNMIIKITDKELLDKTGGIIQGMSGSPIVQDGKVIGAVTHVFINDPTRGYGIFIENMLDVANSVTEIDKVA